MNYASFIYKMIYLNNRLKHAKKIMSIHVPIEKKMIIRLKFVNIFSRGVTQNNKY